MVPAKTGSPDSVLSTHSRRKISAPTRAFFRHVTPVDAHPEHDGYLGIRLRPRSVPMSEGGAAVDESRVMSLAIITTFIPGRTKPGAIP